MKSFDWNHETPILELKDVSIQYGTIKALDGINLSIHGGEIHAIVGEHGAGKSTLAKMVANLISPDSGQILFRGKPYGPLGYKGTIDAGIRMVFQKMQLNQTLTVAENLFIANKEAFGSRGGFFSQKKVDRLAETFLRENQYNLKPRTKVSELGLSDRALLSIIKNLYHPPRILILDEALEKLSAQGLDRVIQTLKKLRDDGCSILFITHRIDDLYMIADRVSVVRKGEVLISDDIGELDKISLIKIAYTQFSNLEDHLGQAEEFNKLMKYNEVILKQLPISLIVSNFENRIRMMNGSAKELFSTSSASDMIDLSLEELFQNNPRTLDLLKETRGGKDTRSLYNTPLKLNQGTAMVNIIVFPIFEGTLLIGNMLIIEDITEREQLRNQLVLSEKLASLGLLAAGVAHEINNPLGVITNYLESFKMDKILAEERDSVYAYLFEQINYITQVIGNLISFSENQSQTTELVCVNEAIQNIIDLIRFNGKQKHIQIQFSPNKSEVLNVRINKNEFKQVILNLFKNAFEVMPDGGHIVITTALKVSDSESSVHICFEDNGPGILFENPSDVFLPFTTSKNTNSNFGLGLSLCYNILSRYDGEITVQSDKENGTQFQITLPLSESV
ncbi:ATP-binding cassette domain-containing protein [Oceanispirochaeta crateris]|uniref:histidine kinase n=1 Tax=Oceanispirochaeta crateris TaxID=2518645 RepID=A0A5C1QSD8_9SPIO|nr:ATP-binding cassette domain-containing protein [Oceanispirochaeta crateris]QEN09554.1 ATP-binding cassette domain-containing protein [Oceanispirochaeta crateris]